MNRSVSEAAEIIGATTTELKTWCRQFADYLSPSANPPKGTPRTFTDSDVLILGFILYHWEDEPDIEAIEAGLNQGHHHEEFFRNVLCFRTPLFQEPPEWLSEDSREGALLGGMTNLLPDHQWQIAEGYRKCGNELVDRALAGHLEAYETIWPILFLYRHALELYFKEVIGPGEDTHHHDLGKLFADFERVLQSRHKKVVPKPVMERIRELAEKDPDSIAFRYATTKKGDDAISGGEYWVDLREVRDLVNALGRAISRLR